MCSRDISPLDHSLCLKTVRKISLVAFLQSSMFGAGIGSFQEPRAIALKAIVIRLCIISLPWETNLMLGTHVKFTEGEHIMVPIPTVECLGSLQLLNCLCSGLLCKQFHALIRELPNSGPVLWITLQEGSNRFAEHSKLRFVIRRDTSLFPWKRPL